MRIVRVLTMALDLVLLSGVACAAEAFKVYVNDRFGATAEVPADWTPGEPPENGDGLSFTSPDGRATIAVAGGFEASDSLADSIAILLEPNDGETITYQFKDARTVVVSGTRDDLIFYRKSILTCAGKVWDYVSIEYPAAQKEAYDGLVRHVAKSLRPGPGWQVEGCRN